MFFKDILFRELSHSSKRNLCLSPSVVDSYKCTKSDEFRIENHEDGQLVPPTSCKFSKSNDNLLAIVDEVGGIMILNVATIGLNAIKKEWLAHTNAIFDVDWSPKGDVVITASGDQTIGVWDVANEQRVLSLSGHSSSVTTLSFKPSSKDNIASGSRDGSIILWDLRTKEQKVYEIKKSHTHSSKDKLQKVNVRKKTAANERNQHSVSDILFQDDNKLISSGSVDGCVKVWDIRKIGMKNNLIVPNYTFSSLAINERVYGITSLVIDNSGSRLFASCRNDAIYEYNCANYNTKPVNIYRHPDFKIFSPYIKIALSPDDMFLLSGSSDGCAYLWSTQSYHNATPYKLNCHRAEVTSVGWCPSDIACFATLSDDCSACLWRTTNGFNLVAEDGSDCTIGTVQKCIQAIPPVTPRKRLVSLSTPLKCQPLTSLRKQLPICPVDVSKIIPSSESSLRSKTIMTPNTCPSTKPLKTATLFNFFSHSFTKNPSPTQQSAIKKLVISPKKLQFDTKKKKVPTATLR